MMPNDQRVPIYHKQSRRPRLTPRQRRRVDHKQARMERLGGQRPEARRPGR